MRIALVHSFYRSDQPSGENVVVLRQAQGLQDAGHEVLLVARHSDIEQRRRLFSLRSAFAVATGYGPDPTAELSAFSPDIVHVHNLFPNFGERWVGKWQGPIVVTLHNFRHICANALLFRDGEICTECPDGSFMAGIRHACYRGSRAATVPLTLHNMGGLDRNTLTSRADLVIVLSDRSRELFARAGGESFESKVAVIPNGLPDTGSPMSSPGEGWTFVGRLSEEKGLSELLRVWPREERLTVVGDGPLRASLAAKASPNVHLTGPLDRDGIDKALRNSRALMFPSLCFESFPSVIAEALMNGIPVVARSGNSGADYVAQHAVGAVYEGDPCLALESIRAAGKELRRRSRITYENQLSIGAWCAVLEQSYEGLLR